MIPQRIFIFGQGQLGVYYRLYFEEKRIPVFAWRVEIRDLAAVSEALNRVQPDLVINAAAKTNIDWCEQNKLEAFEINTLGAETVARVCAENGIYLLHLSSGCVQESKDAADLHSEDDPVSPLCFYSWTKVWAENLIFDQAQHHGLKVLILRPRQLLSAMVSPRNALTKFLTYTRFIDTANSCTIVEDLMKVTEELIRRQAVGLYNVVNPGVITPYEIACLLREIVNPEMSFLKISKQELNQMTLAKRVDAVLDTKKLKALGLELPEIHRRLREILFQFREHWSDPKSRAILEQTQRETREKLSLAAATTFVGEKPPRSSGQ